MKNVKWGIEGYLVILSHQVIGQFDNCGWAYEFQKMVSNMRTGQPVGLLYEDGYSVMTTNQKEEATQQETNDSNDGSSDE